MKIRVLILLEGSSLSLSEKYRTPPPPSSLYSRYRFLPLLETPLKLAFLESLVGRFNIFLDFTDQLKGAVVAAIAFKEKRTSYKDQIREKGEWDKTDMF